MGGYVRPGSHANITKIHTCLMTPAGHITYDHVHFGFLLIKCCVWLKLKMIRYTVIYLRDYDKKRATVLHDTCSVHTRTDLDLQSKSPLYMCVETLN